MLNGKADFVNKPTEAGCFLKAVRSRELNQRFCSTRNCHPTLTKSMNEK